MNLTDNYNENHLKHGQESRGNTYVYPSSQCFLQKGNDNNFLDGSKRIINLLKNIL